MNLVVGATGDLGRSISERLLTQGERVRVLVRPQSGYRDLEASGAEVAFGDLKEPIALPAALEGVTTVICTATATQRVGEDTIETVDREGAAHLIDAAAEEGVSHFVYVSAIGADSVSPAPLFRAKGENEARMKASGVSYTILQPVPFMDFWIGAIVGLQLQQGPEVQIIGEGRKKVAFVAREDVAKLAAAAVRLGQPDNEVLPLSAEALSYREVVAQFEEMTGTSIKLETLAPGDQLEHLPVPIRKHVSELMTGLALGPEMDFTTPEVAERFGVRFTSVGEFLRSWFARPEPV